jgi:protein ImuB
MVTSGSRRILALWFARLATDRLQRKRAPSPEEAPPLVVAAKTGNALKLSAVDRKATALGLAAGMPLANARAMLPALKVMSANAPADLRLLERIADWCGRFTPFVALDPPRGLLLDVTGAAHLFGGERAMLDRIRADLGKQGFAVRGALAGTDVAARALARYRDGTIVPSGEETKAVASLPIDALNLDPTITHAFRRAGLKTVAQVATRNRGELTARFGAGLVFTLDAALGLAGKPIAPRTPVPDCMAERRFAEPVVLEEMMLATLVSLAASLCDLLERRGEGARRLEATFFRTDGIVRRITVETASPIRAPSIIERLFRERLGALSDPLDPGFGFDLIRLSASRVERADAPIQDFDANENAKKEILFLVDRLTARLGRECVLSFQNHATHIPENAWSLAPAQYAQAAEWTNPYKDEMPRRPLRLFAQPEPIEVTCEVPDGAPLRFRWRRALHRIAHAEGPERIAMEWWRHQSPLPTRDYFRLEDEEGRRFWLYRDGILGRETAMPRWFLHGVFA